MPAWPGLGFGFVEIGTVTARPQPGNPRPRLHRLPDDQALINRLGFNNAGADATAAQLDALDRARACSGRAPLGVNLGKSRAARPSDAPADYAPHGRGPLALRRLRRRQRELAQHARPARPAGSGPARRDPRRARRGQPAAIAREPRGGAPRPVLVKIAPDLDPAQVDAAWTSPSSGGSRA